jgi:hypothetical protein
MKLTENFAAGVPIRFRIPGNYFKFDSVPAGLVSARFFKDERELYEELTAVVAGWSARPAGGFDQVEITSTVTQAVSFYINRGEVDSDTFSGVVQVSNAAPNTNYLDLVRYGASFVSNSVLTGNVSQQVVAPGTNTNGVTVWRASMWSNNATAVSSLCLNAHTAAPNSTTVGDILMGVTDVIPFTGSPSAIGNLERPVFVPAGKGVYFTSSATESVGYRHALYTVH